MPLGERFTADPIEWGGTAGDRVGRMFINEASARARWRPAQRIIV